MVAGGICIRFTHQQESCHHWAGRHTPAASGGVMERLRKAIKAKLQRAVDPDQFQRVLNLHRRIYWGWRSWPVRNDLLKLTTIFGSDKWGYHWYAQHYIPYFEPLRRKRLNILEIGIGGYAKTDSGGSSLFVWEAYFPKSRIYGIDFHDKRALERGRVRTFRGDQSDLSFLARVAEEIGRLDIIIDDGSHINAHQLATFRFLFPRLVDGGIYVIVETRRSFWREFGGNKNDLNDPTTCMGYFKQVVDGLNRREHDRPVAVEAGLLEMIRAVHFYHNMIFVLKRKLGAKD